jgi:hypothetical protein
MKYILSIFVLLVLSQFRLWGQCGVGETEVIIEIDGSAGQFNNEVYWRLYNQDTDVLVVETFSGFLGAGAIDRDTLCLQDGISYRFETFDTFGDGWNEAVYNIFYNDGFIIKSGMPDNGSDSDGNDDLEEQFEFIVGDRPGNDCSSPRILEVDRAVLVNTALYTNDYESNPLFDSGKEAIFEFTPKVTDNYTVSFAEVPSPNNGSIQLFDNCFDATPNLLNSATTGSTETYIEFSENLAQGTTYYIVVSNDISSGTDTIQGNLNIAYSGDPVNISCGNAYSLDIDGDSIYSRTSGGVSQDIIRTIETISGQYSIATKDSLFYDFNIAAQEDIVIEVGDYPLFYDLIIELERKENCGEEAEVTFKRAALADVSKFFSFNDLEAGSYRLKIYPPQFFETTFNVSVKTQDSLQSASNQDCNNALNLNVFRYDESTGPSSITSISYFNSTDSGIGSPCSQDSIYSVGTGDVWLKAQAPNSGDLIVQTFGEAYDVLSSPDNALETRFSVYSGLCGNLNEIYCSDKFESHQQDTIKGLPVGEEVFIRLWDRNGDNSGLMNIRLIEPEPLPFPETSIEHFPDSLNVTFTNFAGDAEFFYEVLISEDSFNTFLPDFNPATISSYSGGFGVSGLQPATTYYFQIFSKNGTLSNSDTTVFEVETSPYFINSIANGNWSDPATWAGGIIPPADSAVNIYHKVSINESENLEINSLNIVGAFEEEPIVGVWINNGRLNVRNNVRVEHSSGVPTDSVGIFIETDLTNTASLDVGKDLVFEQADGFNGSQIRFHAINNGDSILINVGNEFSFRHSATDSTQLYNIPNINFQGVDFAVGGNLFLYNDNFNSDQPFNAVFNNSRINTDVFILDAFEYTNEEFQVNFTGNTTVNINFNFRRQGNGGKIKFADQSSLAFNGLGYQEISGFGDFQDSIIYNNVIVDIINDPNSDREIPELEIQKSYSESFSKVLIEGELSLIQGVVIADNDIFSIGYEEVFFSLGATVTGVKPMSYINGPVSKIGNTPFTFPIGHDSGPRQIRILNNEEFQTSDLIRINPVDNFCGLADSLLINSSLIRDRTKEYWEVTSLLSDNNVAATFEPIISDARKEGLTDLASLELIDFYDGSSLGNGASTDSSFQSATEYDFSVADTARLGLSSNLEGENPFYYQKKIESLSQSFATAGENITMNLSGPFASSSDLVYIGGKIANVVSNTENSLTVTVPDGTRSGQIEIVYEDNLILYSPDQFTISYDNPIELGSSNYGNQTLMENINGTVSLGQTKMQLGQINGDNNFDAMIVSSDYELVTVINNLSGATTLQEFSLNSEGTTLNPTNFKLQISNIDGTLGFDAFFGIEYNGQTGIIYFRNDGNGNFTPYGDGNVDDETIYNDYLVFDSDYDGVSDALFSVFDLASSSSILSGESGGITDCSPFSKTILPFLEPGAKELNQILRGNYINNGNTDISYLNSNESLIGIIDIYDPDTIFYISNSRTSDQIFEIKNISLLNNGFDQIVASNQNSDEIEIYDFNNGSESFDITTVPLSFTPAKMVAEDLNGDGFQDLLVSDQNSASIHLLLNDGVGNLSEDVSFDFTGAIIADFDVLDLNNDGLKDFLILQEGGELSISYFEVPLVAGAPNIVATNITSTGFNLEWDSVANASEYEILISLENDTISSLTSDSTFLLSDTSLTFTAPEPFQTYYVFGRAINVVGDSSFYSNSLEVQLLPIEVPVPVSSNPTSNQFDLTWPNVEGAGEYQVYIGLNNDTTSIGQKDSLFLVTNDSITYQAPEYSELYYYSVRAISNSGDTSAFSIQDSIKLPLSNYLEQDSLAMVALYESTNGENWINAENWTTGKLNTWEGLFMINDSLKSINIPANQVVGVLPNELGNLNFVEEIDFSDNSLSDITALETLIGSLNNLNVSGNELSFEQLETFNVVSNFTYGNQGFNYNLPEEYFDFLGADVTIEIVAQSSFNSFQWYKDSVQIAGETNAVLVLNDIERADEGIYYVEVSNDLLNELSLTSSFTELKVSTLERDVEALRVLYDSTNGEGWSSINWDTSSDDPTEWSSDGQDIVVEDNRVVEINLPENNLTGSVPNAINDILGLRTLNVANNAIEDLPDLTNLPSLAELDVSGNSLDYRDLEVNITIDGLIFSNQANFGNENDQKVPQGSEVSIEHSVEGLNNTYHWLRNDEVIDISDSSSITIDSLTYDFMGEYVLEVRNDLINAVDPEFKLVSNPVQLIATANISGQISDANDFPTEAGQVYLFGYQEGAEFDSVRLNNGDFFVDVQSEGNFELQDVELGDYILYVNNDEEEYPDLLNTYFPNTIDWEFAEVISLRNSINDLEVNMEGEPEPLKGTSNFSGYLEEEFEEGERRLPRRRVSGVGVSVRVLTGSSRDFLFRLILKEGELVAYKETDENGEFEIPNLPAGRYSVKFDIPGVPMDEESDIIFDLTGEDQESLEISAVSDKGKITVNRVSYTANKSSLEKNVAIYPNPSTGKFRIEGIEEISSIKIISPEGRLIKKLSDFGNLNKEMEIDLSNYPDGMYFIQILWEDGLRSMNKLIKE